MTPEEIIANFQALSPEAQRQKLDAMPRETKLELLKLMEEYTKRKAKTSLSAFAGRNDLIPAKHHRLMIEHLEALERYDIKNLMMCLPPGAAKSTYSSILFPAWYMGRHPKDMLLLTSNTMELAETFGRRIRNIVGGADFQSVFGFGLSSDSTAAARWSNAKGGELLGSGVGGSIVGRRCDCLIASTLVDTPDGIVSISTTRPGEYVLSVETEAEARPVYRRVVATAQRLADEHLRIHTASGAVIGATGNHLFWVDGNWVKASELVVGNTLLRTPARFTTAVYDTVSMVERVCSTETVYDLQIEGTECFFANGILVHNCLIMDDVVRSKEDVSSETLRERTWSWYTADVLTRLKPKARQVFCNTRWHEDDLAGRILDRDSTDWTVLKLEMENTREDDPLGRKVGERLWAEWFTPDMVDRAKQDPASWSALYQQNPSPEGGGEFKKGWVEYYDSPPNRKNTTNLIIVDPANEKSRKSDYTAMWVIGMGGDGNAYVLDIIRDRMNLSERTSMLFKLHRKYRPTEVRYERYGMMGDIDHIKLEMDRLSYRFRIREVKGQVKKEDRIRRLIPWFKDGKIVFPRELVYTDLSGRSSDLVRVFIEEELAPFPVAKHDDLMDALSRLAEPGLILPKHIPEDEQKLMFADTQFEFQPIDAVMGY